MFISFKYIIGYNQLIVLVSVIGILFVTNLVYLKYFLENKNKEWGVIKRVSFVINFYYYFLVIPRIRISLYQTNFSNGWAYGKNMYCKEEKRYLQ